MSEADDEKGINGRSTRPDQVHWRASRKDTKEQIFALGQIEVNTVIRSHDPEFDMVLHFEGNDRFKENQSWFSRSHVRSNGTLWGHLGLC